MAQQLPAKLWKIFIIATPYGRWTAANEAFAPAWYHHSRRCRTMKELILNADDFGLTQGINHGIIRAHRDGILTSATLMATGSAFDHAVEQVRANPTLGVGCHLVAASRSR
jgi:homogentisate 1,2-dioxygenase